MFHANRLCPFGGLEFYISCTVYIYTQHLFRFAVLDTLISRFFTYSSSSVDMLVESLSPSLMIPGLNLAVCKHLIKVNTNKNLEFLAISW